MFDVIRDPWIKTDNGVYGIRDLLCPMHDCGMVPVTQHLSNALE